MAENKFLSFSDDYTVCGALGSGSYGTVMKAHDKIKNMTVAIKCVPNANDADILMKKTAREVVLLNSLRHPNILSLVDVDLLNKTVYIVTECCDSDLHKLIYEETKPQWWTGMMQNRSNCLSILYQMLQAVKFFHASGVIHRDIKPCNIFINSDLSVKVGDFGMSRLLPKADDKSTLAMNDPFPNEPLTEYMVTRWYRAPEIILNPRAYGRAQDVWSIACTFSEMIRVYPLFPGDHAIDQLNLILKTLGNVTEKHLDFDMKISSREYVLAYLKKIEKFSRASENCAIPLGLPYFLRSAHEVHIDLYDLLESMLSFNPDTRITCKDALDQPLFETLKYQAPSYSRLQPVIIEFPDTALYDCLGNTDTRVTASSINEESQTDRSAFTSASVSDQTTDVRTLSVSSRFSCTQLLEFYVSTIHNSLSQEYAAKSSNLVDIATLMSPPSKREEVRRPSFKFNDLENESHFAAHIRFYQKTGSQDRDECKSSDDTDNQLDQILSSKLLSKPKSVSHRQVISDFIVRGSGEKYSDGSDSHELQSKDHTVLESYRRGSKRAPSILNTVFDTFSSLSQSIRHIKGSFLHSNVSNNKTIVMTI